MADLNRNSDGTFASKHAKYKNIFDEIQQMLDGVRPYPLRYRIKNELSVYAYEWYLTNVKKLSRLTTKNALGKNSDIYASKFEIGGLYQYVYDPLMQSKIDMSAYDTFPLTLVTGFDKKTGNMFGFNLHYASPRVRFFLFAKLLENGRIAGNDNNKKLLLNMTTLQAMSKFPELAACIHQYRPDGVKSNLIQIPVDQWRIAVVMPNANFKKMSEQSVWADSFKKAQDYRYGSDGTFMNKYRKGGK